MMLELFKAAALLLALSLLQGLVARHWRHRRLLSQVLSGLIFGGICVVGMLTPIVVQPGVIFDPRSVIISMAGLFGGPLVAAITAVIAGGYRAWLGGGGVYVGVAVVIVCAVLGLLFRHLNRRYQVPISVPTLLVFGFVVHVVEVLLFTQLPKSALQQVFDTVALPMILIFTPATAFLGLLLKDSARRIETEAALAESEARLSLHLRNTPLAAVAWDRDFRCTQWNKAAERIFGFTEEQAIGHKAADLIIPPSIGVDLDALFEDLMHQRGGIRNVNENITRDGRTIVCEWYNTPITDESGCTVGVVSLAEDVTDKRRREEELKFTNALLTTQQEASSDGLLSVSPDGMVLTYNQRFLDIWQIPSRLSKTETEQGLIQAIINQIVEPEAFLDKVSYLNEHRDQPSTDIIALKDGRVLERESTPLNGTDGTYYGRLWMFRDVTARKRSEQLIWKQANFDALTGLANRQMLRDRLEQEIKRSHRSGERLALLYLDLDNFKDVNDSLGHDLGDRLLLETARRLQASVRESDTVARLGGDEFIVLVSELTDTAAVDKVSENILAALSDPFPLDNELAYVSASIGITFYPDDATDADGLMKNADQAMYAAKDRGKNCGHYFTDGLKQRALLRIQTVRDLREAIVGEQFSLCYQPIVALPTGAIVKAEALLRWQHPVRGTVSPADFVPIAEETRLINPIGDWVFRKAAAQCARWRQAGWKNLQVSINTSPVQFRSGGFDIPAWLEHLKGLEVPGTGITIEITEGLLLDAGADTIDCLLRFRDAGIQVSLDDFGTGYSSLAYLKKFDIDFLKIDRGFVRNLSDQSDDLALCEAIIIMAHRLGLQVIAEGIETERQRDLLLAAGCDYGQGFYFSRPVNAAEFGRLLETGA